MTADQRVDRGAVPVGRVVWIGLLDVAPLPGNSVLGDSKGAFVNVLALCREEAEYEHSVRSALAQAGFHISSIENVRRFDIFLESGRATDDLLELSTHLSVNNPVICDEFQPYLED